MRSNFDLVDQNNEGTNANLHWLESFQKKISPKESFYGFVSFLSGLFNTYCIDFLSLVAAFLMI